MKKLIQLSILVLITTQASAYTSHSGGAVQVSSLRAYGSDYVLFKAPTSNNSDNCNAAEGWIKLEQKTEAQKRQFTLLLSARVSQQPVTLFFNGCSGGGTSGYRLVEQIML